MRPGWGARPENRRDCKLCGRPVAWVITPGYQRNRVFIEPEPDPHGTILVLGDGTRFADLENAYHFSPAEAELVRAEGYPLYVRHRRLCGMPWFSGEPKSVARALDRVSLGHGS